MESGSHPKVNGKLSQVLSKVQRRRNCISETSLWLLWKEKNGGKQEASTANSGENDRIEQHSGGKSIGWTVDCMSSQLRSQGDLWSFGLKGGTISYCKEDGRRKEWSGGGVSHHGCGDEAS